MMLTYYEVPFEPASVNGFSPLFVLSVLLFLCFLTFCTFCPLLERVMSALELLLCSGMLREYPYFPSELWRRQKCSFVGFVTLEVPSK